MCGEGLWMTSKDKGILLYISQSENQKQTFAQFEQQQEKLLEDLLGILDALDRACTYWQEELKALSDTSNFKQNEPKSFWKKLKEWFAGNYSHSNVSEKSPTPAASGRRL